jgi:hypothetical protein
MVWVANLASGLCSKVRDLGDMYVKELPPKCLAKLGPYEILSEQERCNHIRVICKCSFIRVQYC